MRAAHRLEIASGPQNLANRGISQEVISRLEGFDLSGRVHDAEIIGGAGAYADVSRGELKPSSSINGATTRVAIKRMRFHLPDDIIGLFEKEIYVWSKFRHENVARLLGYAFDNYGYPLLISEWMENGNAWEFVTKNIHFDVLPLVIGIAKGLSYLHDEMDAVHSDIKGINVLISNSHPVRAVICDFGTSRIVNASLTLGRPSPSMSSTTRWLAFEAFHLEQASNEFVYTKKMDIWAFGMTIYELHSRRRPYDECRSDIQASLAIISRKLPQFDSSMAANNGELISKICQECWKFDSKERITIRGLLGLLPRDE